MNYKIARSAMLHFFSLKADKCVDAANIEELSVYCRRVKKWSTSRTFYGNSTDKNVTQNQSTLCCWTGWRTVICS